MNGKLIFEALANSPCFATLVVFVVWSSATNFLLGGHYRVFNVVCPEGLSLCPINFVLVLAVLGWLGALAALLSLLWGDVMREAEKIQKRKKKEAAARP